MLAADVNGLAAFANVQVVGLGVDVQACVRQIPTGVGQIICRQKQLLAQKVFTGGGGGLVRLLAQRLGTTLRQFIPCQMVNL